MKQILVMMAAVVLVGCRQSKEEEAAKAEAAADAKIIEAAIREELNMPTGELTKADLEKVTELRMNFSYLKSENIQLTSVKGLEKLTQLKRLSLRSNKLTDVKGLEKLTKLTFLNLRYNALTKAQITELQKALPKCKIYSNPTK